MAAGKRRGAEDPVSPHTRGPGRVHVFPRHTRPLFALIVVLLAVEAIARSLIPLGVRYLVDNVFSAHNGKQLIVVGEVLAAGFAAALFGGFFRAWLFARLQSSSLTSLRQSMFDRLQQLSMLFHARADRDELLEQFTVNLAAVEKALTQAVAQGILPMMECLLCTVLMVWLDWHVGLLGLVLWPWVILAPQAVAGKVERAAHEHEEAEAQVIGVVEETLEAQQVIRAFAVEHLGATAFRRGNEKLSQSLMKSGLLEAFTERFTGSGILLEQILALLLSAWLTLEGRMTIGTMVSLQMLVGVMCRSLLSLVEYLPAADEAREAVDRIRESLREPGAVLDRPEARTLPPLSSEILFVDVSFNYVDEENALRNVTARIRKGSYVAFVGPSGSGKSTILSLLMRFHDPQSGTVTIDGHDLRAVTQASLRAQLGVVLQDGFVFKTSLRENIRVGWPFASDEAIETAVRAAGLTDYVAALPEGLATQVGRRGPQLPGEIVQRLAIARAVLRKPEVLLLDEASSALDPAAEAAISATLREIAKSATVISCTHRLATAADADHIFMLDRGAIVEQGSHFELMAMDGAYANLWQKQAGFRFSPDGRHVDVDAQRLKALPILEALDENFLAELAPYFATETFEKGREIVVQNDPGDKFYIIARGVVEVWRTEEQSGQSLRVNTLHDGDFFGEITLITGFPRSATVRTTTVCTCISLERGQFNRLIDRFPELKRQLSEIAVQRLRESSKLTAAVR